MNLGIFILVHHKPWLIKASLKSLETQIKPHINYEINFVLIKGDGQCKNKKSYKKYFNLVKKTNEKNIMLSDFDRNLTAIIKKCKHNSIIYLENDHGLDSGAWLKIIKKKKYMKYDYSMFLMEGFLFTNNKVLSSISQFIKNKKPDFISTGHEKRIILKKLLRRLNINNKNSSLENYQQSIFDKIFHKFSSTREFGKIIRNWPTQLKKNGLISKGRTENHLPKYNFNLIDYIKIYLRTLIISKKVTSPFSQNIYVSDDNNRYFEKIKNISPKIIKINKTIFHLEKNPYFFGCSCQHIFSKKILNKLNVFFKKNNLFKIINYPYLADSIEIIWGLIPSAFNCKKWFFDGIHRPRKNFLNYKREDNKNGIRNYLKFYNKI
jgi:hypothetical protein